MMAAANHPAPNDAVATSRAVLRQPMMALSKSTQIGSAS
jgi:hypothetical protein